MAQESAADRQAAQQAREQEKRHRDDSSVAVSPDTQRADPGDALDPPDAGEASRGESTVFHEPHDSGPSSDDGGDDLAENGGADGPRSG